MSMSEHTIPIEPQTVIVDASDVCSGASAQSACITFPESEQIILQIGVTHAWTATDVNWNEPPDR